jgi:mRNA-degrading endonuclease RelE of RelBE toxin-antitoxin system
VKYEVRLSRQAEKDLERLDRATLKRVQARIDELAGIPLDPRLPKQLEMDSERRYYRVGNWPIIFAVDEVGRVLDVAAVQHRSRVYKNL